MNKNSLSSASALFIVVGLLVLFAHPTEIRNYSKIELMPSKPMCTTFILDNNGYAIYGTNFDYTKDKYEGLVFVNKRNVVKNIPEADSLSKHVCWTSKYGSVTFNLIASQSPWGGMNEAGLVISLMRLEGSKPQKPDKKPWIQCYYWIQYMLDNFSTVDEVIAKTSQIRIVSAGRVPHYMVCDKYGNCAVIEFFGGKMTIRTVKDMPVKALANTVYDTSIAEWNKVLTQRGNGKPIPEMGSSSRGRFIRAADRVSAFKSVSSTAAIDTAFDILAEANGRNSKMVPNWSIVFDTKNLQVHFKTIIYSERRTIDYKKLDFSCKTPVKILDINEKISGDISDRLKDYSYEVHYKHALNVGKKWGLDSTPEELERQIRMVDGFPCADSLKRTN